MGTAHQGAVEARQGHSRAKQAAATSGRPVVTRGPGSRSRLLAHSARSAPGSPCPRPQAGGHRTDGRAAKPAGAGARRHSAPQGPDARTSWPDQASSPVTAPLARRDHPTVVTQDDPVRRPAVTAWAVALVRGDGAWCGAAVFWPAGCLFPCDRLADAKLGWQPHSRPGICGNWPVNRRPHDGRP